MSRARRFALAAAAIAVLGCVPQPRPTASTPIPGSTPAAGLCAHAEQVFDERGALGDAYELVIEGDVPAAARASHEIQARLRRVLDELRVSRIAPTREDARVAIRTHAEVLDEAAAVIADRGNSAFDRDVILGDGRSSLPVIDEILRVDVPNDPIVEACPTIAFAPEPITFPAAPTNPDLGLPDVVGELLVEQHVGAAEAWVAEALEMAEVDSNRVRQTEVFLSDIDGGGPPVKIIDGAVGSGEELARAIQQAILPGAKPGAKERWAAFDVFSFRQSAEPPGSIHVAVRGDRVVVLLDAADAFARHFLEAIR
jgi:hypothetical protein